MNTSHSAVKTRSDKPDLVIIELDYHAEILTTMCPLLAQHFNVYLLTTEKIWRKAKSCHSSLSGLAVKSKKQGIREFIDSQHGLLSTADLVYFNTMQKFMRFFSRFEFSCKTVWRIHNLNSILLPKQSLALGQVPLGKIIYHLIARVLIQGRWRTQRRLLARVDYLMAPSTGIIEAFFKAYPATKGNRWLPFVVPFAPLATGVTRQPKQNAHVITVTGTVDPVRKDYEFLYRVMEKLRNDSPKPIELHFLGGAQGKAGIAVLNRFKQLHCDDMQIFTSQGYVSDEHVAEVMAKATCMVAPIRLETTFKVYRETYGFSKVSGFENDIRRYAVPCFYPKAYKIDDALKPLSFGYEDEKDLVAQLLATSLQDAPSIKTDEIENALQQFRALI